ncbi:MAG: nicotinate (nicotinamide) nucleotide adenylyltransferase [Acidobacteria bacterium]|nr:nicotinate (nicotinamide) nucleotide adenylyltransferase [Acidobacteriota bacterium]
MRVGILGGTFDPIHYGHLEIANHVQQFFGCDQIYLMPAYTPPHKTKNVISSAYHRYAMAVLATSEIKKVIVCRLELESPSQPFTIQTITQLKKTLGKKAQLFLIIGADLFCDLNTWYKHQELIHACHIVVVTRPGYKLDLVERSLALNRPIKNLCGLENALELNLDEPTIFYTNLAELNISASNIRLAISKGEPINKWVPLSVINYINKYQLYQNQNE